MEEKTDIALRKYELIVRNIEFLDGWVMRITAIYGVFIFAIIVNIEKIGPYSISIRFWIVLVLIIVGVIFFGLLQRIDNLIIKTTTQLDRLEPFFGELADFPVIHPSWGKGLTTTVYCRLFVGLTTIVTSLAILVMELHEVSP